MHRVVLVLFLLYFLLTVIGCWDVRRHLSSPASRGPAGCHTPQPNARGGEWPLGS